MSLSQLEQELTYEKFKEWTSLDMTGQVEVEVRLPRFKMEETYDLNDVLTHMGMVDAFDGSKSDFSGETKLLWDNTADVKIFITLLCFQACLQGMTWCCQRSCTRLLWR